MRFYLNPVESDEYPGFYLVPDIERLVVSKQGHFIDIFLKCCYIPTVGSYFPYPCIRVIGDKSYLCHRLIAKTFLLVPGGEDGYMVNHLDGDKLNVHLDNLEWCTPSENAKHAYMSGLRNDNTPVEVIDLRETDPVPLVYYSMQECARSFGKNAEVVHRWLNGSQNVPFCDYYNLRYQNGDWKPITNADIGAVLNGAPKTIVGYNGDGVVYIFESYGLAARHVGSSIYHLNKHALCRSTEPIGGFLFRFFDDFDGGSEMLENAEVFRLPKSIPPKRTPTPIRVTNQLTGHVEDWDSTEQFSIAHGVKKNTLQKAMLRDANVWKHFKIEYRGPLLQ